jgi:hypothetical protein
MRMAGNTMTPDILILRKLASFASQSAPHPKTPGPEGVIPDLFCMAASSFTDRSEALGNPDDHRTA